MPMFINKYLGILTTFRYSLDEKKKERRKMAYKLNGKNIILYHIIPFFKKYIIIYRRVQ